MSTRLSQAGSRQSLVQALAAIALAAYTYTWAVSLNPVREAFSRHLSAPEEMLVKALIEVSENRVAAAFDQIENLLRANPNFHLAQLVKGDLLLSRTRAIETVGAGAPAERVADFREEARARLARYAFQPPTDLAPRNFLELSAQDKYVFVIDTSKSTLFVFENDQAALRYVADFYVTVGKNGPYKLKEGDKRTPLGVYHVTGKLPKEKLSDFYGAGAFPLNYPNEWDRMLGRNGSGIWLHGTPFDTYSRPPRASDGCVVLANEDLQSLEKYVQLGRTPVVITERIEWAPIDEIAAARADLSRQIEQWRSDWESRETEVYLRHYSKHFSADGVAFAHWAAQKRRVNSAKSWIKVGISDVSLVLYPGERSLAVATFDQDYASSNLSNRMTKRQYWVREDGRWKIVFEGGA